MQPTEDNQVSAPSQAPIAIKRESFVDQARALPRVLKAHERLCEVSRIGSGEDEELIDIADHLGRNRGPDIQRFVVMDDYAIAGSLLYDHDSPACDPLQDGHANGRIYHRGSRRSMDAAERASFFEALGRDQDGGRDFTAKGTVEELIRHVSQGIRANRSVMSALSHQLRSRGESGSWDLVLKVAEEAIRRDGAVGEFVLDNIAQKFFGVCAWRELPAGRRRKLETLVSLLSEDAIHAAWERGLKAGTIGNPLAVLLDIYEHSGILYSVSGEGMQCRWDTSGGAAVWVPDKDAEDNIRTTVLMDLGIGEIRWFGALGSEEDSLHARYSLDGGTSWQGPFASWRQALSAMIEASPVKPDREALEASLRKQAVRYCRGVLEEYNAWVNGEVYVVQVKVFDRRTGRELVGQRDLCGGFIGMTYAEESLEEAVLSIVTQLGAKAN